MDLQITVRDLGRSEALVAYAQKRAEKLPAIAPRLQRCRVAIEAPHRHKRHGRIVRVRVHMTIPGHDLVVERAPIDHRHQDAYAAVDDAFDDAARVLEQSMERLRGDVKPHVSARHGRVKKLFFYEGFGFLEDESGDEIYFHENSVLDRGFRRLSLGTRVRFVEEAGERGPQASTVAIA